MRIIPNKWLEYITNWFNGIEPRVYNNLRVTFLVTGIMFTCMGISVCFGSGEISTYSNGVKRVITDPTERIYFGLEWIAIGVTLGFIRFKVFRQPRKSEFGFAATYIPGVYPLGLLYKKIFGPTKSPLKDSSHENSHTKTDDPSHTNL